MKKVAFYVLIIVTFIVVLFPIFWLILTSLKTEADIFSVPPQWIPSNITFKHYIEQLTEGSVLRVSLNSLAIALTTVFFVIIIASFPAYSFARYKFKGEKIMLALILIMRMIPVISVVIPLFLIFSKLRILDTWLALIIIQIACKLPFATWLLKGFFSTIPLEIEECAKIDGCSLPGILLKIIFPLAKPGLAATAIIAFLFTWNDFLITLAISSTIASRTLPVELSRCVLQFRVLWGRMSALGVIMLIPVVIFVLFSEKGLIKGLTMGGIKG